MIINGEKFACQSCVKGHRVSNCNHHDRPLQPIAPKGRPVKQCDHCRDARKVKSHHTKCDCGSKRTKDKAKGEPKSEDRSCCCHKGEKCVCGNKAEANDLRLETSLSRPTVPVKSKPKLVTHNSENAVTLSSAGPQRPHHRHNSSAQLSGQPYRIPRPGTSGLPGHSRKSSVALGRAVDDMVLTDGSHTDLFSDAYGDSAGRDNFNVPQTATATLGFDWENFMTQGSNTPAENGVDNDGQSSNAVNGWLDNSWTSVTDTPIDFSASPNFNPAIASFDMGVPPSPADVFSPADLPLESNPANPAYANYVQPISNSGESGFQSVPGMTTASSNAQSEFGEAHLSTEPEGLPNWGDTAGSQVYPANAQPFGNFAFGRVDDAKFRPTPQHRHTFSFDSNVSMQSDRVSESSTVVPTSASTSHVDIQGINAGHLENLATLRNSMQQPERMSIDFGTSVAMPDFAPTASCCSTSNFGNGGFDANAQMDDDDFDHDSPPTSQAIIIPAGTDDIHENFSWSYSHAAQPDSTGFEAASTTMSSGIGQQDSAEYDWLR